MNEYIVKLETDELDVLGQDIHDALQHLEERGVLNAVLTDVLYGTLPDGTEAPAFFGVELHVKAGSYILEVNQVVIPGESPGIILCRSPIRRQHDCDPGLKIKNPYEGEDHATIFPGQPDDQFGYLWIYPSVKIVPQNGAQTEETFLDRLANELYNTIHKEN